LASSQFHSRTKATKSDFGARPAISSLVGWSNSACASSAAARWSSGRSRGSCADKADTTINASANAPVRAASISTRASRGSTGSRAIVRPISVSLSSARASSSCSSRTASRTARGSGGSMNPNVSTSPNRNARMVNTTAAKLVRLSSGSVYAGRDWWSASAYNR